MSWTYSGNPADSDRDAVRFEIQDTDETGPLLQDEEIDYALAAESSVLAAAARCCEALSRKFAQRADLAITSGDDKVQRTWNKAAEAMAARAGEIRARATVNSGIPWHGGGSIARKDSLAADTDRVQPRFKRGDFDAPGTVPPGCQ